MSRSSFKTAAFREVRSAVDGIKLVIGLAENEINGKASTNKYWILMTLDARDALNSGSWSLTREFLVTIGNPTYLTAIIGSY